MELNDALALITDQVKNGTKHTDYKAVTDLATKLQILITGNNSALLLRRYVSRESAEEFVTRCAITRAITPAVAASVKIPFYKVARNQRIRSNIDVKDEVKNEQIKNMAKGFYGSSGRKTKGLDYWLKTRFMDLTFTDPNAWVIVEWDAPQDATSLIQARPFEVSSAQAWNFNIVNEEVFWLFTALPITYIQVNADKEVKKAGRKFTLYDKDYTITWEQCDKAYYTAKAIPLGSNQTFVTNGKNDSETYLQTVNTPKLGFVPAFRIGYNRDLSTNGRTYVNPFHDGMCYFDKSLKTVSELDLTMTQHAFPQKVQYAPACKGAGKQKKCMGGYLADGTVCGVCNGTGFAGHKSSMDVLNLPLPTAGTPNSEVIDLSKLIAYITPDIKLLQFLDDYISGLEVKVHSAVFNSQVFVRKSGGGGSTAGKSSDGQTFQTATENDNNMQSVYDALEPFTEKFSDVWEDIVTVLTMLANVTQIEDADIDHVFPADFKLKTTDILLGELKVVSDSGAPSFMKDRITADLAEIVFAGDTLGLLKLKTQRRYFPFNGKGADEIALLLSSPDVPRRSKILYSNFELIFTEIEIENPNFYVITVIKTQDDIVNKKVEDYKAQIDADTPALDINSLRKQMTALPIGVDPGDTGGPGNPNNSQG
jgi:hypothetical protein